MRIVIETIPHRQQRYPTLGDWIWTGDDLTIQVSESGDWRSDVLVALHEFVEVFLCKDAGVTQDIVDAFDKAHLDSADPGDEVDAPYRDQHCFAMAVERMMAAAMNYPWKQHEDTLADVESGRPKDYPAVKHP